jgi:hypothetical protein
MGDQIMTTQIKIHNVASGEIVEREMTEAELAQREASQIAAESQKSIDDAKAAQKVALLAKLGITADEAALLLS